ncbi:MAG: GH3 auxin-responsive promoter family protein [Peptococcaceae bacterium]|nr:GH3 auxin-responsive promoter family protein [Peptococcaceae bacterium]
MEPKKFIPEIIMDNLEFLKNDGFQQLFDHGIEIQEQVLKDIIDLGSRSDYAKDNGFWGISSKASFLKQVPISEYEDYASYIQANMVHDDQQVSALDTEHYLLSTGRTRQGKYFVETYLGSLARQLSIILWNLNLQKLEPVMSDSDVKMLAVTNCSPLENAPNGKAVRRTSGQAAKELWETAPERYVFPFEFLQAEMSERDRDYLTALYLLKEKHFNILFCNNLAYFGVLLECIEKEAEQLILDIRQGTMSVSLLPKDREVLSHTFIADPERADELLRLLEEKGKLVAEDLWPEFVFTGAWLAGSVGDFSKDVMRKLPRTMHYLSESYGASEAMLTLPVEFNVPYGPLAIYSCYFEFLPLQGNTPLSMKEVKSGEYYELIVSTYSGLYRYNLHDIVRVCGFTGNTANIEFCCRSTEKVFVAGKNVYGYELSALITEVERVGECAIDFYQMKEKKRGVVLFVQFGEEQLNFMEVCRIIRDIAAQRQLPLTQIYWIKEDYRDQLYQSLMDHGRTIQCIKLPILANEIPSAHFIEAICDVQ